MQKTKFDKIAKVLRAVERAETARLKAKLNEISAARGQAVQLRLDSKAMMPAATVAEMQVQSKRQHSDEANARALEQQANVNEQESQVMKRALSLTLGRIEAADSLAAKAHKTMRQEQERRTEDVPKKPRRYAASPPSETSASSSVGTA